MNIIPVAFDSMGVRSMCTFVNTPKLNILIDPGLALAKKRLGFPPSNIEFRTFNVFKDKIVNFAKRSDIILVTHYHYSHYIASHDESFDDIYSNKIVLCKNRKRKLNFTQRNRGKDFEINVKSICKEYHSIDNKTFNFDNVTIECSPPLWHGSEKTSLGYIVIPTIKHKKEKLLFGSDITGPVNNENTDYIIKQNPDTLILSSIPTYLLGYSIPESFLDMSIKFMKKIIAETNTKTIIYDHYHVRDINYKRKMRPLKAFAKNNDVKLLTAAEYTNTPIRQLEARREELSFEE